MYKRQVMERVGAAIDVERLEELGREAQAEVDSLCLLYTSRCV